MSVLSGGVVCCFLVLFIKLHLGGGGQLDDARANGFFRAPLLHHLRQRGEV
jgi:hypothetical protein